MKLNDPYKMLIANSPSLQKSIQNGLKQFQKLTQYKSLLNDLSLKLSEAEDSLLDEILKIEDFNGQN